MRVVSCIGFLGALTSLKMRETKGKPMQDEIEENLNKSKIAKSKLIIS
jgi:hypothetical protein